MDGVNLNPLAGSGPIDNAPKPSTNTNQRLQVGFKATSQMEATEGTKLEPKDPKSSAVKNLALTTLAQAWKGEGNIGGTYQNASEVTKHLFKKESQ